MRSKQRECARDEPKRKRGRSETQMVGRARQVRNLSGQQKLGIVRYSWLLDDLLLFSLLLACLAHPNLSASVTMRPDTFQESTDLLFGGVTFPVQSWPLTGRTSPGRTRPAGGYEKPKVCRVTRAPSIGRVSRLINLRAHGLPVLPPCVFPRAQATGLDLASGFVAPGRSWSYRDLADWMDIVGWGRADCTRQKKAAPSQ